MHALMGPCVAPSAAAAAAAAPALALGMRGFMLNFIKVVW